MSILSALRGAVLLRRALLMQCNDIGRSRGPNPFPRSCKLKLKQERISCGAVAVFKRSTTAGPTRSYLLRPRVAFVCATQPLLGAVRHASHFSLESDLVQLPQ